MKTLEIRDAGRNDLQDLLALNQSNLPHVGSISMPDLEHLYSQAVYLRVAEFERQTAGFLIAFGPKAEYGSLNFRWFKKQYNAFVYIDRIVVAPEARRKGIAVRLYQDLEQFAAERTIPIMACEYNLRPKTRSPAISTRDTVLKRSAPRKPKTAKRRSRFKSNRSTLYRCLIEDRNGES